MKRRVCVCTCPREAGGFGGPQASITTDAQQNRCRSQDGCKEYKYGDDEDEHRPMLCIKCVDLFRSALGQDCDLGAIMHEKINSEETAKDIDQAIEDLAADNHEETEEHNAGEILEHAYEVSTTYRLKSHGAIVKKYKKTPIQLRLKALRLKKKNGDASEVLYPVRHGGRVLKVYDGE